MSKFETILFDMDGVIANTEPLHMEAEREACRHYGLEFNPDDWAGFKGRTAEDIANTLISRYDESGEVTAEEFVARKTELFLGRADSDLEPIPGVLDFLAWSRQEHGQMSLVTSSNRTVQSLIVARFGIEHLFDAFITGDDIPPGEGKPHPRPYLMSLEALGAQETSSLVIEDSTSGIKSAKAAGCSVLAIATSHSTAELETVRPKPDFIAPDYATARVLLAA